TMLAPRTDCVSSSKAALEFLQGTSREFIDEGEVPSSICFIAHRFIPARSSAFALARPGKSRVLIDSLWGLPDGLEFCPHDSFEIDVRGSGRIVARKIRYKPQFLAPLIDGKWKLEALEAPWDWRPSLTDAEIISIAQHTARLATHTRSAV